MKLAASSIEAIKQHALESYPDECCGVIVEHGEGGQTIVRIRNIQDEMHQSDPARYPRTARTAYSGHPSDLKAALELAARRGNVLAAFYHSHPDHDAYFSEEDVRQATPFGEPSYPEALQVVVSVYGDEVRDLKAFAWSPESGSYESVSLDVT